MSITFENATVTIGGETLLATNASIEDKVDYKRVDGLAFSTVEMAASRPMGSFSADFFWTKNFFETFDMENFTGLIEGSIGEMSFSNAYITEISMSADPLSPMKGSIKGDFVGISSGRGGQSGGDRWVTIQSAPDLSSVAHGANSSIASNENMFSVEISYSRQISPIFAIGSNTVIGWEYEGGEVRCRMSGSGMQKSIETCQGSNCVSINLKNACNYSVGNTTVQGLTILNSSLTVDKAGDVVGSIEMVRYF